MHLGLLALCAWLPGLAWAQSANCARFGICYEQLNSTATVVDRYTYTAIVGAYPLPRGMLPGTNTFGDSQGTTTSAVVRASEGFCVGPACVSDNPFLTASSAQAQTGYGINRAAVDSGLGRSVNHNVGGGISAFVHVDTSAVAFSLWRDVWEFSADGHFSATVSLDGGSSLAGGIGSGNWRYSLQVLDMDHLSPDVDGFPAPTPVATLLERHDDERRSSFASSHALDFDFEAGVTYVITAAIDVNAVDGRAIDLFNTARLHDVALSGGAELDALSGHVYVTPVPEPGTGLMTGLGLAAVLLRRRRNVP